MSKVTLRSILSSYSSASALNANFQIVADEFENTLSRDGTSPNYMLANIDMNSYQLLNLGDPTLPQHAVTKAYVDDLVFTVTDSSSTSVIADGGTADRSLSSRFADMVNIKDYFLSAHADYTIAIAQAAAICASTGKEAWAPPSATPYITDMQTFTSSFVLHAHGATIKLKDSATLTGANLSLFKFRAGNSGLHGGTYDFNRDNQGQTAFNTAGGGNTGNFYAISFVGALGTYIEDINIRDVKVINSVDYGIAAHYVRNIYIDAAVHTSGSGILIKYFENAHVNRALLKDLDNDSWKVYPHAFDAFSGTRFLFNNIIIDDQAGYNISGTYSLSNWFTGITLADVRDGQGSNWIVRAKNDDSMTKSVGVSLVGIRDSQFTNMKVNRYTSCNLELGGLDNCHFNGVQIDGEYLTTSLWAAEPQMGVQLHNQGFYENISDRMKLPVANCTFTNVRVKRVLGYGCFGWIMADTVWTGCKFSGNQYGFTLRSDNVNDSFPGANDQVSRNNKFVGCEFSWNEVRGFYNGGSTDTLFVECSFINNGQAKTNTGSALRLTGTFSGTSSGYYGAVSGSTNARLRPVFSNCTWFDDQSVTTAPGSVDPANPTVVSVTMPELYSVGQTISIANGATGPATLIAQILSIENDELTLDVPLTNFPLTAASGTILTAGTSITFSTSQTSAINGRTWVKYGTDYRQIVAVASNGLSGTLSEAFPADISPAAAFDLVTFDVAQIRCQNYGLETTSSLDDGIRLENPNWGVGNITGKFLFASTYVITDFPTEVLTYASLQTLDARDGQVVQVSTRATSYDGGGGSFRFISSTQATSVTNDPQKIITVPPTSDTSGASGAWRRVRDNPNFVRAEWAGAIGDNSTDDWAALQAALDYLGTAYISGTNTKQRGGTLWLSRKYLTSDVLTVSSSGITIEGPGIERVAATVSTFVPCSINGNRTTKPVLLIRNSDTRVKGIEIGASATRQAGTTQTGDDTVCGIMIATADSSGASMNNVALEDVLVRNQVDDGYVVCGDMATIVFTRCVGYGNGRMGILIERGDLIARTNKARPGIVSMYDCRFTDSGGYNICVGHPSDAGNSPYRILLYNVESYRGGLTTGKLFAGYESCHFFRGEEITAVGCAFAGTGAANAPARSCAVIAAVDTEFRNCRWISPLGTHYVKIEDITGYATRFVRFVGGTGSSSSIIDYFASINPASGACLQLVFDNVRGRGTDYTTTTDRDTVTLSSDAFSLNVNWHRLTSQAGAADNLSSILGGVHGQRVILSPTSGHTITVKHNVNNILCTADQTLDNPADRMVLEYDDTLSKWCMVSFVSNL